MPLVFITGSGRRLGRGLALEFAHKNWDVAVHYNSSEQGARETSLAIQALGQNSLAVKADILSYSELEAAFINVVNSLGVPDVLINNAGIFPEPTNLENISPELWEQILGVNLRGEFFCSQLFAKYATNGARIVNIGSIGAFEVWKHRIPYNVSKAAVVQLTKALALELAPKISVNCVCPGGINMPDSPSRNDTFLVSSERIPMKRHGTVGDVFDAVYFFATASSFITGQVLTVDGGWHLTR